MPSRITFPVVPVVAAVLITGCASGSGQKTVKTIPQPQPPAPVQAPAQPQPDPVATLIAESDRRPDPDEDDERRRYYELTKLGRAVLEADLRRLEAVVGEARRKRVLPKATRA